MHQLAVLVLRAVDRVVHDPDPAGLGLGLVGVGVGIAGSGGLVPVAIRTRRPGVLSALLELPGVGHQMPWMRRVAGDPCFVEGRMGAGVEPESVVGELCAVADVGDGVVVGGGIRMAAVASVRPAVGLRRIDRVGLRLWNREEYPGMVRTGLKGGLGAIPQ